MSDDDRAALANKVSGWREKAAAAGPQHSLWDAIVDAEALLRGNQTLLAGAPQDVYARLMEID